MCLHLRPYCQDKPRKEIPVSLPHLNGTPRPAAPEEEKGNDFEELPEDARMLFAKAQRLGVTEQDIKAAMARLDKKKKQPTGETTHETV